MGSTTRHRQQPTSLFWAGALLAISLTGCQAPQADAVAAAPAPPVASEPPPAPGLAPSPSTKISVPRTASVLGLRPRELEEMLGVPKFVRRDAPAEVWQYRSDACVLDVFIYQVSTGAQVKYAEARTMEAEPARTDDCVNTIRQQKSTDRLPT